MKYLKWCFGNNLAYKENEQFEVGEVLVSDEWDPHNADWDKHGGFNLTNEKCAFRWVSRGDTLYEAELPDDAEIVEVPNYKTPGGIFIANKIILKNPKPISEEMLIDFYKKSDLPLNTYFECIGIYSARGYYDLALMLIKDKVNMDNIDDAIETFNNSIKPWHKVNYEIYNKVKQALEEIKSNLDINLFISKEPYVKQLTNDKIINLTGQSGSGKSTYANNNFNSNEYEIIDTDEIFNEVRYEKSSGLNKKLGEYFREKYDTLPNLMNDFDLIYNEILEYCKNFDKTIVIDCAQFPCVKDISILKGKIIIIRTDIDTCYNRTISRWINSHKQKGLDYTEEELNKYKERKKGIYLWYKETNNFINKIDEL